jgi:non-heme chloroperoxidase
MNRREALGSVALAIASSKLLPAGVGSVNAPAVAGEPPQPQSRPPFIDARDGTRIHFRDWGTGRPIIFVAPWGLCSDWWDIPVTTLSERGWRCVTFDRRGHGRSDDPCHGYDFDTLADDIATVLDGLDVQNAVLVGHSMGGAEVVRYLTRHRSHRVTHAVLIAPTTPFTMKTDFFGVPKNSVSTQTMDWWCRMLLDRVSIKVLTEMNKVQTETDFRPELRTIQTPTLILHGDIDKSVRLELTGRPTHELIAGSRLLVYENAAHALPYTHTERMLADIVAFARS